LYKQTIAMNLGKRFLKQEGKDYSKYSLFNLCVESILHYDSCSVYNDGKLFRKFQLQWNDVVQKLRKTVG